MKLFDFKKLWKDESGATAIEYGLLAALIAVVIIGAVRGTRRHARGDVRESGIRDHENLRP